MRPIHLHIVSIVAFITICFAYCVTGYQIALPNAQIQKDTQHLDTLLREKRQMENFDETEFSNPQEAPDDPSFWDRVVRVAIKLFSKFVEWLNS